MGELNTKYLSGETSIFIKTGSEFEKLPVKNLLKKSLSDVYLWNGYKWVKINGFKQIPVQGMRKEISFSDGNKIYCLSTQKLVSSTGEIKSIDELQIGDTVKKIAAFPNNTTNINISDKQLVSIAYWITRGNNSKKECSFALQNVNNEQRVVVDFIKGFSCENVSLNTIDGVPYIQFISGDFIDFVLTYVCGKSIKTKTLTNAFWNLNNNQLKTFLSALINCVDHKKIDTKTETFVFPADNSNFINDLRILTLRLGYTLNTEVKDGVVNCTLIYEPSTSVEISNISAFGSLYFYDVSVDSKDGLFALANGIVV